jgi:hypothetical protein
MKKSEITKIQELISELKNQIGNVSDRRRKKSLLKVFQEHFCLYDDEAKAFLENLDRIVCGATYEALPPGFLSEPLPELPFRQRPPKGTPIQRWRSRKTPPKDQPLKRYAHRIRSERDELKDAIEEFWKLPDEPTVCLLEKWKSHLPKPFKKWRGYLLRLPVDTGDEILEDYPAAYVANEIIAERWESTASTIETYCKKSP